MSILPDSAELNEVEFNKTRAATHLNTLHLQEHEKCIAAMRLQLSEVTQQLAQLRRDLEESKVREHSRTLGTERLAEDVALLRAALCNGPKASRSRNSASQPMWQVKMPMPVGYIQAVEARAQPLGISASTYIHRIVAGIYPPLPELVKCIGAARLWKESEEERRKRKAQHKCDKEACLEVPVPS